MRIFFLHIAIVIALGMAAKAEACSPHSGDKAEETHVHSQAAAFDFRALATPSNMLPQSDVIGGGVKGTHNVDNDWGLWGHNLWRVVGKNPSKEVYAMIEGERDTTQFCFSSTILYKLTEEWIIDQWGEKGQRFSILPADNKKVCQCLRCRKAGNNRTNATPAVVEMLTKLAQRFPDHQFFMAAYHTTMTPPTKPLPKNVGVQLTTMSIPYRYNFYENKGFHKFDSIATAWQKVAPLLYVWEYERNFDDYLSPYPCLTPLKERLAYYRKKGITGVFINGSEYEYSSFDDVQSYVIAQLLLDPSTDIEQQVREFYSKNYPVTGKLIADYYLTLEQRVKETNHILPYYGTIEEEVEAYLNPSSLADFYHSLCDAYPKTTGRERKRVDALITALSFTRLLLHPSQEERPLLIKRLENYRNIPCLRNWKESHSPIEEFLRKINP